MKLIFASHNPNKVREIEKLLPWIEVQSLADISFQDEIPETGATLRENALIKAQTIFDHTGRAVFADDTGLEVDALNGEPGVYSARYAGPEANSEANMQKLLSKLKGENNRAARFKTVIAYIDKDGSRHFFEGIAEGEILHQKAGERGFGYDPVFKPAGKTQSFAQLDPEVKNQISHRGKALREFARFIQQYSQKS